MATQQATLDKMWWERRCKRALGRPLRCRPCQMAVSHRIAPDAPLLAVGASLPSPSPPWSPSSNAESEGGRWPWRRAQGADKDHRFSTRKRHSTAPFPAQRHCRIACVPTAKRTRMVQCALCWVNAQHTHHLELWYYRRERLTPRRLGAALLQPLISIGPPGIGRAHSSRRGVARRAGSAACTTPRQARPARGAARQWRLAHSQAAPENTSRRRIHSFRWPVASTWGLWSCPSLPSAGSSLQTGCSTSWYPCLLPSNSWWCSWFAKTGAEWRARASRMRCRNGPTSSSSGSCGCTRTSRTWTSRTSKGYPTRGWNRCGT